MRFFASLGLLVLTTFAAAADVEFVRRNDGNTGPHDGAMLVAVPELKTGW